MTIQSGQRITPATLRTYLVTSPDSTYPKDAAATGSESVSNRITLPAVTYDRLLTISSHTLASYSQAGNRISARLYLNGTLLDKDDQYLTVGGATESFKLVGTSLLAATTAGVVEVRFVRLTGTGLVTTATSSDTILSVQHRAA